MSLEIDQAVNDVLRVYFAGGSDKMPQTTAWAAREIYKLTRPLGLERQPLHGLPRSAERIASIPLNPWAKLVAAGHQFGPQGCTAKCCKTKKGNTR